jgi:dUTP pyrophosphatase
MSIILKYEKIKPEAITPKQATSGSAGFDLFSTRDVDIHPGETVIIDTGLRFEIPDRHLMHILSKSGLARYYNIVVLNSPALIDSDYHREVSVILHREVGTQMRPLVDEVFANENDPYHISKGDKIAQFVILPYPKVTLEEGVVDLDMEHSRGGFGSTGK